MNLSNVTLPLLLVASAGLNVALSLQLRAARAGEAFTTGGAAPELTVSTVDGAAKKLMWSGGTPTVIYFFSPSCGWCEHNRAGVIELESQLRGRYRFIAVSLGVQGLAAYLAARPFSFPVFHSPQSGTDRAFGVRGTPHTAVVSADGRIERVWSGAWAGKVRREMEGYFDARLPHMEGTD